MSRKIPDVLTKKEQEDLLNVFNTRYPTQERNRSMIKLMLDTGLRLSETINLKWKHIESDVRLKLKVKEGKGAKDRMLWVPESSSKLLYNWKEVQKEEIIKRVNNPNIEHVFTTLKGNKLKSRNIREMVYKYSDKAGLNDKDISPHTMRHTFATDFLKNTKNIRMVQKALGHSNISTTMIYTHIIDDDLADAMVNFRD